MGFVLTSILILVTLGIVLWLIEEVNKGGL